MSTETSQPLDAAVPAEPLLSANALTVLENRYLMRDDDGQVAETPVEMFRRVAKAVATAERKWNATTEQCERLEETFYRLMAGRILLPNSPTLMNAGRRLGMLSACFVLPIGDSIDEIMETARQIALVQRAGGGTGIDLSALRPKGSIVRSSGGTTDGPLSFLKMFSAVTDAIQQGAFRRGANMGIMRVDHPDILAFIDIKSDLAQLANYNLSVAMTDVCPRCREGDSHDQAIETVRCVWCDIDDVKVEQANVRFDAAGIPVPSILVNSGSGIHAYWLLDVDFKLPETRSRIASMLPYFYRSFGGDHVHNLSRVLRLPGTFNYKDARNGRPPLPCTLCSSDARRRYPLATFRQWVELAESDAQATLPGGCSDARDIRSLAEFLAERTEAWALVSRLDRHTSDRSRRDFAVVCDLLRLGFSREAIWQLVSETSKFRSNGRKYFDVTISNAERAIFLDGTVPF